MANLISVRAAADAKGVSVQLVKHHIKAGQLRAAARDGGRLIDSAHPAYAAWLARETKAATNHTPGGNRVKVHVGALMPELERSRGDDRGPINPNAYLTVSGTMTPEQADELGAELVRITEKYGTREQIYHWAKSRKEMASAQLSEMKYAEFAGKLVRRDFVEQNVTGYMDGLARVLLTETAPAIAKRLAVVHDRSFEQRREIVAELLGREIKRAKQQIDDNLRKLAREVLGDDSEDESDLSE